MVRASSIAAILAVGLGLTACAGKSPAPDGTAASSTAPPAAQAVQETRIVECRERPRVKQLGRNVRYSSGGPTVRITAEECARRGGHVQTSDQALLQTR